MKFCLVVAIPCAAILFSGLAVAQATNNNPAATDAPVFLDNHRPPNKKKEKEPTTRNVSGKVVDINGTPLQGALVTLTNVRTQNKTTIITKPDGRYRFDDLSFTVDYQVQARYKAFAAEPRKLSQYDHNVNVVRILQIDDSANGQTAPAEAKKNPPSQQ